ncbi:MAG: OmpA family protein [Microscillaceae bacterium]|nr:OmpA family protein [Microscillaceae bacterium]
MKFLIATYIYFFKQWFGAVLAVFLIISNAQANEIEKLLKEANEFFRLREYSNAIPVYHKVLDLDSNHLQANYQLGIAYQKSTTVRNSLIYLQKVQKINPEFSALLDYYLAEAYKFNNQMPEAIRGYEVCLQKFKQDNPKRLLTVVNDDITVNDFVLLLNQRLKECRSGIKFLTDPTVATVRNMGDKINSEYSDYAPVISGDETVLIFTSRRPGSGRGKDREDLAYYEDIYIANKKKGEWVEAKSIGRGINSKFHEASIALSNDGKQLFVYQDENGGDIYVSELSGKKNWSSPKKLSNQINTKYREPSVSITDDGKTLYFSSDRPGGFGGLDIYKVDKNEKGEWGEPVNLGEPVNTDQDEDSPFIHFDRKTLYFSSNGHETMGGFDIFYSELIENKWTLPTNLGYPINTVHDDIHFVLSANYRRGYYASDQKEGLGGKDIYIVDMPDYKDVEAIDFQLSIKTVSVGFAPLTTKEPKRAVVILRGVVRDELTDELLSAKMSLIDIEDNQPVEEINATTPRGVYYTTMTTGKKYLLHVQKEGYMYHTEYFEIPVGVVNQEKVLNIYLKRIKVSKSLDFKALFDYNSAAIKSQTLAALDKLYEFLKINSNLKGEIAGHTDNIGSDSRNKTLSEQRAKAVYDYLVKKGIDKDRLSFAGYGYGEPIATNETPHGRSLNRRTEFKVLEISSALTDNK